MFVALLIGFGGAIVLLSPMQEPAVDMAVVPQNQVGMARNVYQGSFGALPRNAPQAFTSQLRQPVAASNYGSLYQMATYKSNVLARAAVALRATADTNVKEQLQEALKAAEECVGECAVEWDNVEELSAAAADKDPPAATSAKLSKEDVDKIKATKDMLASAREKVAAETQSVKEVDEKVLNEIVNAVAGMKEVRPKMKTEAMKTLDAALNAAIEAAKQCQGDECAVAWETVEELSEAKSNQAS